MGVWNLRGRVGGWVVRLLGRRGGGGGLGGRRGVWVVRY